MRSELTVRSLSDAPAVALKVQSEEKRRANSASTSPLKSVSEKALSTYRPFAPASAGAVEA